MRCICGHEGDNFPSIIMDGVVGKKIKFNLPAYPGAKLLYEKDVYVCPCCGTLKIGIGMEGTTCNF
jgi:hypothetical protein